MTSKPYGIDNIPPPHMLMMQLFHDPEVEGLPRIHEHVISFKLNFFLDETLTVQLYTVKKM